MAVVWLNDLETIRLRVRSIRRDIVQSERSNHDTDNGIHLNAIRHVFPITYNGEQERALTRDHGIHVVQGGRVNVALLKPDHISTLKQGI